MVEFLLKIYDFFNGREKVLNALKGNIFSVKVVGEDPYHSRQKASNTFQNFLNGARQIIYSLHRAKEITK